MYKTLFLNQTPLKLANLLSKPFPTSEQNLIAIVQFFYEQDKRIKIFNSIDIIKTVLLENLKGKDLKNLAGYKEILQIYIKKKQ